MSRASVADLGVHLGSSQARSTEASRWVSRRAVVVGRRQVRPGLLQNGTSQGRIVLVRLGVSLGVENFLVVDELVGSGASARCSAPFHEGFTFVEGTGEGREERKAEDEPGAVAAAAETLATLLPVTGLQRPRAGETTDAAGPTTEAQAAAGSPRSSTRRRPKGSNRAARSAIARAASAD